MSTSRLLGPVIAGKPDGFPRYWERIQTRNTQKRSKPTNLLVNPTQYSASKVVKQTEGDYYAGQGPKTPQYGSVGVNPDAHAGINQMLGALESLSDSRILGKIKNETWNLGTFAGELPTTQKYLREAIPRMVKLYSSFKRRLRDPRTWKGLVKRGMRFAKRMNIRRIQSGSGSVASAWLEFRYAVMPLTYDIQDALNFYHSSALRARVMRVSSGASDNWGTYFRGGPYSPATSVAFSAQVRTVCYYSVNQHADAVKRLGLINLPAVLWELTPLSFVADMVLPIGDFIGNLDAMVGVTVLSCTRSTRSNMLDTRLAATVLTNSYGGSSGTGQFYKRAVIPAPVNKPRFSKSPTGRQLCDIVALQRTIVFK